MKKLILLLIASLSFLSFSSCVSGENSTRVRVYEDEDVNTRDETNGDWNDSDLRDVAKTIITQMLNAPWYQRALDKKDGELPIIKIGAIKNKTDAHLPLDAFNDSMQKTLINSGRVEFISNFSESQKIRKEKEEQLMHASDETIKGDGEEAGADYMIFGQFSSMYQRRNGRTVRYLQANIKLIDIETNKIVWVGEKKIKKFVKQSEYTW